MEKIKLMIDGFNYTLPDKCLETNGSSKRICLHAKHVATMFKQYISKKYPEISCWCTSDTYAGGSSVHVYISKKNGEKVSSKIYNELKPLEDKFSAGSFDGMTDSFNYKDDIVSDFDTRVTIYPKYVFIENAPKFATLEYYMKLARGLDESVQDVINEDNFLTLIEKKKLLEKFKTFK